MDKVKEICDNCKYYFAPEEERGGELCRRYPPTIQATHYEVECGIAPYCYPEVSSADWCGEYKPKEE